MKLVIYFIFNQKKNDHKARVDGSLEKEISTHKPKWPKPTEDLTIIIWASNNKTQSFQISKLFSK